MWLMTLLFISDISTFRVSFQVLLLLSQTLYHLSTSQLHVGLNFITIYYFKYQIEYDIDIVLRIWEAVKVVKKV